MADWMVVSDPPVHTRLRRLVSDAFKPQRVLAMEASIRALVDELLDAFVAEGHHDLVPHFAYPLPATVIAAMVGAPPEDRDVFREWSQDMGVVAFGGDGDADPERHARAQRGLQQMIGHFLELIERARESPGDHLLSNLMAGDADGDRLSDAEIAGMCALLLFAGHETTTNLIASSLLALQRNPAQRALLLADPATVAGAVEESLRYDGPVKVLVRWTTEDVDLRGVTITAQSKVYLVLSSANRDPEKFPDPTRFDITRSPNPHLGFGRSIHTCLGAQLARVETRVALAQLFGRFPELTVGDAQVVYHRSREARAVQALGIELGAPAA
jgi:cytochrome P450